MFYINISTYELAEGHAHRTHRTGSKLHTRGLKKKIWGVRWEVGRRGEKGGISFYLFSSRGARIWERAVVAERRPARPEPPQGVVCQHPDFTG